MNYESMTDRELDALVAEKVMGERFFLERRGEYTLAVGMRSDGREPWLGVQNPRPERYTEVSATKAQEAGFFGRGIKRYSDDISHAFEVVEAMRERGRIIEIKSQGKQWEVTIIDPDTQVDIWADKSLPRAIVIAALKATDE